MIYLRYSRPLSDSESDTYPGESDFLVNLCHFLNLLKQSLTGWMPVSAEQKSQAFVGDALLQLLELSKVLHFNKSSLRLNLRG